MQPIAVGIVDDNEIFRRGLIACLASDVGIALTYEAGEVDMACSSLKGPQLVDDRGRTGYSPRVLRLNDGTMAIVYGDATEGALEYAVYR